MDGLMSRCHGIQCQGNLHGVRHWPSKLSQFCQSLVCCHTSVCQSLVCCRLDPDFFLCFLQKTDLGPQVRLHRLQPEKAEVQSIRQGTLLPSLHLKTCVFFVSGFLLLLWNLHFMFSSCRCIGPTTFSWALRSEIQRMVIGQCYLRFDSIWKQFLVCLCQGARQDLGQPECLEFQCQDGFKD